MEVLSSYGWLAELTITETVDNIEYHFESGDVSHRALQPKDFLETAQALAARLDSLFFSASTTDDQVQAVADDFLSNAAPPEIVQQVKQWNGAGQDSVLVVEAVRSPWLADLPWELISSAIGGGLLVVRRTGLDGGPGPGLDAMTMLMAGWNVLPTGQGLPGVKRELEQTPKQLVGDRVKVAPIQAPSLEQLVDKVAEVQPDVIHLVTANGYGVDPQEASSVEDWVDPASPSYLWLNPLLSDKRTYEQGTATPERLSGAELVDALADSKCLRLCVVNTMPNPPVAITPLLRTLITGLGVAVVGWIGAIEDSIGADFSVFLYSRLIEGATLPEAVRSFARQFADTQWVSGAIPVIWVPSTDWVDQPVMAAGGEGALLATAPPEAEAEDEAEPAADPAPAVDGGSATGTPAEPPIAPATAEGQPVVTIDFAPQESLFPSLLINGQDALKTLTLTASQECDVLLEIICDAGGRSSEYRRSRSLLAGPNTIDLRNVGFPVLYELMTSNEPRIVNFQVAVSIEDVLVAQITRSVRWRARREWLDSEESHPYLPSFVLPMSRSVADLIHDAEAVLTQIGGPQESFSGYKRDANERSASADRHMKAIYQAMRAWNLKYITPPGAPVFVLDPSEDPDADVPESGAIAALAQARIQSGQLVRFPDDIVERRHATCHDLSLMFAAAIEYVNLRPVITVLPGHTLAGFWTQDSFHTDFWLSRSLEGVSGFGSRWRMTGQELADLVEAEKVTMVETTMVTNPVATWEQAKRRGRKHIQQEVRAVIDVRRSRESIQPLSYG